MRRHCQFTVKRFEVNYSNMGLELTTSCLPLRRPIPANDKYTAASGCQFGCQLSELQSHIP